MTTQKSTGCARCINTDFMTTCAACPVGPDTWEDFVDWGYVKWCERNGHYDSVELEILHAQEMFNT